MKALFKNQKSLYITYFALLLVSSAVLYSIGKGDVVIWMNGLHRSWLDTTMVFITRAGEFGGYLFVLVLLLSHSKARSVIAYIIACALMLAIVSWLKHIVFSDHMRPALVLEDQHLHFVRGLHINKKFSFPSGHTTAGFTYFFFFALTQRRNWLKIIALITAVLVGASRIYLAQHFLEDVIAGSILGVTIASLAYFLISEKWLGRSSKLDRVVWT